MRISLGNHRAKGAFILDAPVGSHFDTGFVVRSVETQRNVTFNSGKFHLRLHRLGHVLIRDLVSVVIKLLGTVFHLTLDEDRALHHEAGLPGGEIRLPLRHDTLHLHAPVDLRVGLQAFYDVGQQVVFGGADVEGSTIGEVQCSASYFAPAQPRDGIERDTVVFGVFAEPAVQAAHQFLLVVEGYQSGMVGTCEEINAHELLLMV